MMVAPDKAAEAAVRGKHPTISSFFSSGMARRRRAIPKEKKKKIWATLPRAALRLPGATIMSSLCDFSRARRARIRR
jgi:hypothetical protein